MNLSAFDSMLAMAQPPGTAQDPKANMLQMLLTMLFFGVVMYFVLIRPQQKKTRELQEMMKSVKPGDKVVTTGGIVGVIVGVKEKSVSIRSSDAKLEVLKSAVAEILERGASSESQSN